MATRTSVSAWAGALLLAVALPAAVGAMEGASIDADLVAAAETIAVGRVTAVESVREGRHLTTHVSVDVEQVLKGGEASRLSVVVPGGYDTTGKHPVAVVYPGAPRLLRGQEVVLLLDEMADGSGAHSLVGLSRGVFSVVRAEDGRRLVTRAGGLSGSIVDDSAVSLEHFAEQVREPAETAAEEDAR